MINPGNYFILIWEFLMIITTFLFFDEITTHRLFEFSIWADSNGDNFLLVLLGIDTFIIQFLSGLYKKGVANMDPIIISKKYLKFPFWTNLLAFIAVCYYLNKGATDFSLLFFVRLFNVWKSHKKIRSFLRPFKKLEIFYQLLGYLTILLLFVHTIACTYYFYDVGYLKENPDLDSWLYKEMNGVRILDHPK